MVSPSIVAFGAGTLLLASAAQVPPSGGFDQQPDRPGAWQHVQAFTQANPGAAIRERAGRITRVFGRAFSQGASPQQSAESFLQNHAAMFGVQPQQLVAVEGDHVQPVMYQPDTGTYKFTRYAYRQELDGVPVFRSALRLLVRNLEGYPLVLASVDLHDLGGFQIDPQIAAAPMTQASSQAALQRGQALTTFAGEPQVMSTRRVIWAGVEDRVVAPRLADETVVGIDLDRWLIVTDVVTGDVLFEEHRIFMVDVTGSVNGRATEGIGAEQCEEEVAMPLPYAEVVGGLNATFTDADGNFVLPNEGGGDIEVTASLNGQWFDVFNASGPETSEATTVTPPGPADLLFNADNTSEQERAQVNIYVGANRIRDFVLQYNPAYPTLSTPNFETWANRTDGFCPQNAWYSPGDPSINFCLSSGSIPNTAWSSVIYHEYGHHLVEAGGSGQCEYGEGMGDVMSVLILDDPNLGWGFFGDCSSPLRDADNNCQYSPASCTTNCGGPCHSCGQLLSGVVWSIRNGLVVTEPADYIDVLSNIVVNSILVHTGSSISPDIALDYLTLDDDDADICNGTPHFSEITTGFADHGLFETSVSFAFPGGLPQTVAPAGGTTVPVTLDCGTAPPDPGTGLLHVDTGGGFVSIPMTENSPNEYDAVFPASTCGSQVLFYFSAETGGQTITEPADAPVSSFSTISATSLNVSFTDDFEADQGWAVSTSALDGPWQRDVPIPNNVCDRGNPGTDADGSSQCYVTDNSSANGCNSDVDDGSTTLTSPVLDATGGDAFVSYWRWYDNTFGSSPEQDIFVVEVSDDAGGSWTNLETVGPSGSEVAGGWFQKSFRISDFVTANNQFRIRFTASDTDPQSVVEAGVDGVEILVVNCDGGVPGDADGDGIVGINDFLLVIGNWGPCPLPCPPTCQADLTGDCEVGIDDFLLVIGNWTL